MLIKVQKDRMLTKVQNSLLKLKDYCEKESFKGYDPYDGLNSHLFQTIPFVSAAMVRVSRTV